MTIKKALAKEKIEWLHGVAEEYSATGMKMTMKPEEVLQLTTALLASLEAEPVCVIDQSNLDYLKSGSDADVWPASRTEMGDVLLYRAAPPAPVSDSLLSELLGIAKRAAYEADECAHAEFSDDSMERSAAIADWERRAAMLDQTPVKQPSSNGKSELLQRAEKLAEECGTLAQRVQGEDLRAKVRADHAEWATATFGNTGPVGPLKHLSKEALEAAEAPQDLHEWADMQFLLWDAQRKAGVTDEQITAAMVEKLEINKARQWPEPKDGEPRFHIKGQ